MEYSFFLFTKLFDQYHIVETPYDILHGELIVMHNDWQEWDKTNGLNIPEYESMCEYLATHTPDC